MEKRRVFCWIIDSCLPFVFPFMKEYTTKKGASQIRMHHTSTTDAHNNTNAEMHRVFIHGTKTPFFVVFRLLYKVVVCGASLKFYAKKCQFRFFYLSLIFPFVLVEY